jgi:hypothetical protein
MADFQITQRWLAEQDASRQRPVAFDPTARAKIDRMLTSVWEHQNRFVTGADGRPYCGADDKDLDSDGNTSEYVTFSEGVGYKLFREVLMGLWARKHGDAAIDDKARAAFERTAAWSAAHLRRDRLKTIYDIEQKKWIPVPPEKRDSLLAWRWVPSFADREGGIIHAHKARKDGVWIDGLDAAPDGDFFTIAALRMASLLWPASPASRGWSSWAREMAVDARRKYARQIGGRSHLLGGDEFHKVNGINPSYGFEAIHGMLADLDLEGAAVWRETSQTSFENTVRAADATLHRPVKHLGKIEQREVRGSVHLPPNWVSFDGTTYSDIPWPDLKAKGWYMGWDAVRTLWMKGAFFLATGNPDARRYLLDESGTRADLGPRAFLRREFLKNGRLRTCYSIDGSQRHIDERLCNQETPFANGNYLGYFYAAGDRKMATALVARLSSAYRNGQEPARRGTFEIGGKVEKDNYYSDHWAWMGLAMAAGLVEDFFAGYNAWRASQSSLKKTARDERFFDR